MNGLSEFEELVNRMRNAQKEYFRTHDMEALRASKRLETAVDRFLRSRTDREPDMFDRLPASGDESREV